MAQVSVKLPGDSRTPGRKGTWHTAGKHLGFCRTTPRCLAPLSERPLNLTLVSAQPDQAALGGVSGVPPWTGAASGGDSVSLSLYPTMFNPRT